jgi:hypothetical protein
LCPVNSKTTSERPHVYNPLPTLQAPLSSRKKNAARPLDAVLLTPPLGYGCLQKKNISVRIFRK